MNSVKVKLFFLLIVLNFKIFIADNNIYLNEKLIERKNSDNIDKKPLSHNNNSKKDFIKNKVELKEHKIKNLYENYYNSHLSILYSSNEKIGFSKYNALIYLYYNKNEIVPESNNYIINNKSLNIIYSSIDDTYIISFNPITLNNKIVKASYILYLYSEDDYDIEDFNKIYTGKATYSYTKYFIQNNKIVFIIDEENINNENYYVIIKATINNDFGEENMFYIPRKLVEEKKENYEAENEEEENEQEEEENEQGEENEQEENEEEENEEEENYEEEENEEEENYEEEYYEEEIIKIENDNDEPSPLPKEEEEEKIYKKKKKEEEEEEEKKIYPTLEEEEEEKIIPPTPEEEEEEDPSKGGDDSSTEKEEDYENKPTSQKNNTAIKEEDKKSKKWILPVCIVCGVVVIIAVVLFIFKDKLPCFKKNKNNEVGYDDLDFPKEGITDKPDNAF